MSVPTTFSVLRITADRGTRLGHYHFRALLRDQSHRRIDVAANEALCELLTESYSSFLR